MLFLRMLMCYLMLALGLTHTHNLRKENELSVKSLQEDRDEDISGLVQVNCETCDACFDGICDNQSCGKRLNTSCSSGGMTWMSRGLRESVVLEESVFVPTTTEGITLDIVFNVDMFVEFHESHKDTSRIDFTLAMEDMGDNPARPEFIFDYQVVSLGLETEILIHVADNDSHEDATEKYISTQTVCLVAVIGLSLAVVLASQSKVIVTSKRRARGDTIRDTGK